MQDEQPEAAPTDEELLRQAAGGSRAALEHIARRYAGFVYHAALRNLRDPHAAADVTQAVFLILATKVHRLKPRTVLHAWLFATTRYAAANARKLQARRAHHEQVAAAMRHETTEPRERDAGGADERIGSLLDEALADLRETDRAAVLLSYFGGQTFAQVGARLGKSEEAARKRVGRAVVKMRAFFARRGAAVGVGAIVTAMTSRAGAGAPAHVVHAVHACVAGAPVGAGATGIAGGVAHMLNLAQLKLAALCVAGALVVGAGGAAVVLATGGGSPGASAAAASSPPPVTQPTTQPTPASVQFRDGARVELLGLATVPVENGWWDLNGRPVPAPIDETEALLEGAQHQAAVHVDVPLDATVAMSVGPCKMNYNEKVTRGGESVRGLTRIEFIPASDDQTAIGVYLRMGSGPFRSLLDCADPAAGAETETRDGPVSVAPITDDGRGRATAVFTHTLRNDYVRAYAIDADGKELNPISERTHSEPDSHEVTAVFDAPPEQIKRLRLDARALNDWVQFTNVPLDPTRPTASRVLAGDDPATQPGR